MKLTKDQLKELLDELQDFYNTGEIDTSIFLSYGIADVKGSINIVEQREDDYFNGTGAVYDIFRNVEYLDIKVNGEPIELDEIITKLEVLRKA